MTTSEPAITTDSWAAQLEQLKARYKHVRQPILVALNILLHDPNISVAGAKAQAAQHGTRITAASVAAAQRLLERRDAPPAATSVPTATAPQRPARRDRPARVAGIPFDAEALVRGVVAKIQGQGSAETERIREAVRRAIAALQAAIGS